MTLQKYATFKTQARAVFGDPIERADILKMIADFGGHRTHTVRIMDEDPGAFTLDWHYGPVHGAWDSDVHSAVRSWKARNPEAADFLFATMPDYEQRTVLPCPKHGEQCGMTPKVSDDARRDRVANKARLALMPPVDDIDIRQVAYDLRVYLQSV